MKTSLALSLRGKFLIWIISFLALMSVALEAFHYVDLRHRLDGELREDALRHCQYIGLASRDLILTNDLFGLVMLALDQVAAQKNLEYIFFTDSNGRVIASSFSDGFPVGLKQANAPESGDRPGAQKILSGGRPILDVAFPLMGGEIGTLRLGLSAEHSEKNLRSALKWITVAILINLLAVSTAIVLLTRRIARPLKELEKASRALAMGDWKRRVEADGDDEIGRLGFVFNAMADELENAHVKLEEKVAERTSSLQAALGDLQQAQKKLVQTEKMSAVGQLAAGVAHEINNPLGVILGFAQGAVQRIKPGDPLELPLKSIEREAVRCKNLVQDLLTFSRRDKSDHVPVDINKAIEGAISLVNAGSKMNAVEIRKDLADDLPHIPGVQSQIQQIVINLANNAIDAMPEGGVLGIATEFIGGTPHSWLCVRISDTGEGIPQEVQLKMFEPFFTTKPVGKGTGLGLSLAYEIVKKYSGTIDVQSRPGFTEFCVKFPVR